MSSVEYLTPGTSAWTERTSENTEDLIADPFWRTKQSSNASKDAIIIRCGVGFIKRSTDGGENWSTITPGTDPPNDAGDSPVPTVAGVTFHQLDGSISTQGEFVALARWQNVGSEWRSWLAFTANNGTSWAWKFIGSTSGGSASIDLYGTPQHFGANDDLQEIAGWNNPGAARSIAFLTETKIVCTRISNADVNGPRAQACVVDISGDTLTEGAYYNASERDTWDDGRCTSVIAITSSKFLYVWGHYTGPTGADYDLRARIGTVSGTAISWGTGQTWAYSGNMIRDCSVDMMGSLFAIVAYSADGKILARILSISGTNFTINAEQTLINAYGDSDIQVAAMDDTYAVIALRNYAGDQEGYVVAVQRSGTSLTAGSEEYVTRPNNGGYREAGRMDIISMDSTTFVVATHEEVPGGGGNREQFVARVGTISGTTITLGNIAVLDDSSLQYQWDNSISKINDTYFIAVYANAASNTLVRLCSVVGVTVALGTEDDAGAGHGIGTEWCVMAVSESKAVVSRESDDLDQYLEGYTINFSLPTIGVEVKSLGLSMGKGLGDVAYVTAWDESSAKLRLLDYALPTLVLGSSISLGGATEAETNNKTWIAYPFSVYGNDSAVVIFGRMDAPQGLSSPEHIIYTLNGGSNFFSIENGWGLNHCGSLIAYLTGNIIAVRNDSASSRLYTGDTAGLLLKSVLSLNSGVDPHGMAIDPIDGTIVACAGSGGSVMVALCLLPYTTWIDITTDHGITEGINAVAVL